jgi:hypothetical protein
MTYGRAREVTQLDSGLHAAVSHGLVPHVLSPRGEGTARVDSVRLTPNATSVPNKRSGCRRGCP